MLTHLRAASGVTAAAVLYSAAAAVLGVICARFLGPSGQGSLTLIVTVCALTVVLLGAGSGASLRLRASTRPTESDLRAYLGLSAAMAPVAAVAVAIAVAALSPDRLGGPALVLSALLGLLSLLARQASDLVQAFGRASTSILALGVGAVVQVASFAAVVVLGHASLTTALACAVLGATAQLCFAARSARADGTVWRPTADRDIWRTLVRIGAPTLGYTLGLAAVQRADRLILVALAGPAIGGVYAVAATVAEASRIASSAVGQLLFVRTAAARAVGADVRRLYQLALLLQLPVLAVLALAAPWVIHTFFGPQYADAVDLLRGLLVAEFFMGMALMDSRIIMGLGRFTEIGSLTLAAVVLAVALYLPLVRLHGAGGAVLASTVCYAIYGSTLFARRVRHSRQA